MTMINYCKGHFCPTYNRVILCYGNGMVISVAPECKIVLYAGDSIISFSHKDLEAIRRSLTSLNGFT